jgi:hypothetical protein
MAWSAHEGCVAQAAVDYRGIKKFGAIIGVGEDHLDSMPSCLSENVGHLCGCDARLAHRRFFGSLRLAWDRSDAATTFSSATDLLFLSSFPALDADRFPVVIGKSLTKAIAALRSAAIYTTALSNGPIDSRRLSIKHFDHARKMSRAMSERCIFMISGWLR